MSVAPGTLRSTPVRVVSGFVTVAFSRLEQRRWSHSILLLIPLLYLVVLYAIPILVLLVESFVSFDTTTRQRGALTLAHYIRFLSEPTYFRVLWTTLRIGVEVTLICLVLSYPLAYALARAPLRLKNVMLAWIVSPLLVSIVIRTFAWMVLLRTEGVLNKLLVSLNLIAEPIQILFTETALIIALVHVHLPFMIIPIASVIEKIDPSLEAAATSLGANGLRRFKEVILPLSVPGMAAGCMLVLTTTVSAYVTPALLAGDKVLVMPTLIAQQIQVLGNWSFGSAIATILVVVVLAMVVLYARFVAGLSRYRLG